MRSRRLPGMELTGGRAAETRRWQRTERMNIYQAAACTFWDRSLLTLSVRGAWRVVGVTRRTDGGMHGAPFVTPAGFGCRFQTCII